MEQPMTTAEIREAYVITDCNRQSSIHPSSITHTVFDPCSPFQPLYARFLP
jgi:hypothetical protein